MQLTSWTQPSLFMINQEEYVIHYPWNSSAQAHYYNVFVCDVSSQAFSHFSCNVEKLG